MDWRMDGQTGGWPARWMDGRTGGRADGQGGRTDRRTEGRGRPSMIRHLTMHQITAGDPRAQTKFFLLMTELHYRFVIGVERP